MGFTKFLSPWRSQESVCFQIMSDLHLEVGQQYADYNITPRANRLILAGDIGRLADYDRFRDFLLKTCQKFIEVYLVLGNHEFFGISRPEGLQLADKLQQEDGLKDKLIIMNRKRVDLGNITLLGCTLHSHIPSEAEEIVRCKINDFRRIVDWTVSSHTAEHFEDVRWLKDEITSVNETTDASSKRKIVVISHHAPTTMGSSKPSHSNNPWSSAFATELIWTEKRTCLDDVQWWVFGHTHHTTEFVRGRVRLISNQRGYVFPNDNAKEPDTLKKSMSRVLRLTPSGKRTGETFDPERFIEISNV